RRACVGPSLALRACVVGPSLARRACVPRWRSGLVVSRAASSRTPRKGERGENTPQASRHTRHTSPNTVALTLGEVLTTFPPLLEARRSPARAAAPPEAPTAQGLGRGENILLNGEGEILWARSPWFAWPACSGSASPWPVAKALTV